MNTLRFSRLVLRRYSRQNVLSRLAARAALAALLLCASAWTSPEPAAAAPPNPLTALSSSLTQVSAGQNHTCALRSDGSITCWGLSANGRTTPPSPNSGFIQLSAGKMHTCAVRSDSSLACWGYSGNGQATPPSPSTGFTQVGAGAYHTCAVKSDSSVACWGYNGDGRSTPPTPNSGFTQVTAGNVHTCALKSDGSIACWGPTVGSITTPNSGFTQVSAGDMHTCALRSNSSIACWGDNNYGQVTPPTPNSGFTQVSAGAIHTCALRSNSSIACWGDNDYGQATPPTPNSGFTQVSAGTYHTCALKSDGSITCWGMNDNGQAPTISLSPGLPAAIPYSDSYSQALTAGGGPGGGPYTFDVIDGTLPPGLNLSTSGTIAGTPTQAGSYSFTLRALDAIHYNGTRAYTLVIPRAPLSITANDASRAYGDANPTFSATFIGLKNNDPISASFTTPAVPASLPGTYPIVPAAAGAPALLANYIIITANATLTVGKAPLTVRADDLTRPYGSQNPPPTYSFIGLKNGEGPGVVSGPPPLLATNAATLSPPGDYPILIMGSLTAENYDITYANGTLRVEGAQVFLPAVRR